MNYLSDRDGVMVSGIRLHVIRYGASNPSDDAEKTFSINSCARSKYDVVQLDQSSLLPVNQY